VYLIGALQLETRYSFIHAFIFWQFNLWNWVGFWGEAQGVGERKHFLRCYWTSDIQVWLCKICVWVAVGPCLQSVLCWVGGSRRVRLIRTELHPPLPLFGDSLQQLLDTTAALDRHSRCSWGTYRKKN